MAEHYSPLRYPGGKARLTAFLIEVMQANGLRRPEYVEPYAGGAGAALRLLFEEYADSIVINDADPRVRCFWTSVTGRTEEFLDRVRSVPVTVDEWHRQRAVYLRRDLRRVLDVGFATFFLNRTTRSGIIHNGGPIGGHDQTGNYKIDARFNRAELVRRIYRIGVYADRISVTGLDGLELLKELERDPARAKSSFVYLDPPYYAKGDEFYLNRFTHAEHAALADFLGTGRAFSWVMTYDEVPSIRSLYRGVPLVAFSLSYSAYERRLGSELLIHPAWVSVPSEALDALPLIAS